MEREFRLKKTPLTEIVKAPLRAEADLTLQVILFITGPLSLKVPDGMLLLLMLKKIVIVAASDLLQPLLDGKLVLTRL